MPGESQNYRRSIAIKYHDELLRKKYIDKPIECYNYLRHFEAVD